MVSSPIELFHQPSGAGSDLLASSSSVEGSGVVLRQCHCGVLPEEVQRDEVLVSQPVQPTDPLLLQGTCHRPLNSVNRRVS